MNNPAQGAVPVHVHVLRLRGPAAQLAVEVEGDGVPLEGHVHEGGGQDPAPGAENVGYCGKASQPEVIGFTHPRTPRKPARGGR